MDIGARLQNFVGRRARAVIVKGTVSAVKPLIEVDDDIERAINLSDFTLRLDDDHGTVVIPGHMIDELDNNAYLIPEDCPWMEFPAG